jgi:lysophospholipase L1-like esterase
MQDASSAIGPDASAADADAPQAAADAGEDAALKDAAATSPSLPGVLLIGRFDLHEATTARFAWPGSAIVARFRGTAVGVTLDDNGWNHVDVRVDGATLKPLALRKGRHHYVLAAALAEGVHTVRIARRNEGHGGVTTFRNFDAPLGEMLQPPARPARRIQFIGDSITCGYGSEGHRPCPFEFWTENHEVTYAALAARYFGAESHVIAKSGWGLWRGADGALYGSMTRVYDRLLPDAAEPRWEASSYVPDVIVINLSTNDYGTGNPGNNLTIAGVEFLGRLRELYPLVHLVVATSPMLGGTAHATSREQLGAAVSARNSVGDARVTLLDFPEQRLADGLGCDSHPGKITHQKMAEALQSHVARLTGWGPALVADSP